MSMSITYKGTSKRSNTTFDGRAQPNTTSLVVLCQALPYVTYVGRSICLLPYHCFRHIEHLAEHIVLNMGLGKRMVRGVPCIHQHFSVVSIGVGIYVF